MKNNNIPEILGIIVSFGGIVVMAGWFLDVGVLKSIVPAWVSMKFSTALSFFLSGIVLYFMVRFQKKDCELAIIIVPIISMVILLLMVSLLASTVIGINVGVEEMFVRDSMTLIGSVTPGRPSVATMLNFILMALAGIMTTLKIGIFKKIPAIFGLTTATIGFLAIIGYIFNLPWLYFSVVSQSSAMAIHTAVFFVLLGVGLILTDINK